MKRHILFGLAALLLLGSRCDDGNPADVPPGPWAELVEEAEAMRTEWNRRAVADYTFRFTRICFCPPLDATVEVRGGNVFTATDYATGGALDPALLPEVRNVPELFDFVAEMAALEPDTMTVRYDPEYFYPAEIAVDRLFQAADDEISLRAEQLVPAGRP